MKRFENWQMPVFVTMITLLVFNAVFLGFKVDNKPSPKLNIAGFGMLNSKYIQTTYIDTTLGLESPQRVHPVRINGEIFFAGEAVPLADLEVRERFDRELLVNTFWHSNTFLNYKLANKYFAEIEVILKENGVPEDFKYLAVAESGLRNVNSPAGAAGFWQFLKVTAEEYDLEINAEVDERYDYEKSTIAACKYLQEAKSKFGSWTLAAASYNVGKGKLSKSLDEQQVSNYYDLYLNSETSRYVFRILSYKMLFENPKDFGFYIKESDLYLPYEYKKVVVETSIPNLAQFAIDNGITYKMLKVLNPWLIADKLTISEGNSYTIKIATSYIDESYFDEPLDKE